MRDILAPCSTESPERKDELKYFFLTTFTCKEQACPVFNLFFLRIYDQIFVIKGVHVNGQNNLFCNDYIIFETINSRVYTITFL